MTYGWRARIVDDWPSDGHRLLLARSTSRPGEAVRREILTARPDAVDWIEHPVGTAYPADAGIWLPPGAWEAIVEAVHPHERTAGELAEVRDALKVERGRVDRVWAQMVDAQWPPQR